MSALCQKRTLPGGRQTWPHSDQLIGEREQFKLALKTHHKTVIEDVANKVSRKSPCDMRMSVPPPSAEKPQPYTQADIFSN